MQPFLKFDAREAAQHFVPEQQDEQRHRRLVETIQRLWGGNYAEAVRCKSCGFGFAYPFVGGDVEFYSLSLDADSYFKDKWDFKRTIEALTALRIHGKALEIGAGAGFFLDKVSPTFFQPTDVTALEFNANTIVSLRARGYKATSTEIFDIKDEQFDAIFMFQVLEHMDSPRRVFAHLKQLLKPGGHLFITVPNGNMTDFSENTGSLMDMPPNHIGRWNSAAFQAIAAANDLTLVDFENEPLRLKNFVKQDLIYSYIATASKPGTIANKLYSSRKSGFGRAANAFTLLVYGLRRVPIWVRYWPKLGDLGSSLWVHLKA